MNRHDRRAAQARARKRLDRRQRVMAGALKQLDDMRGKPVISMVHHDAWCNIYKGGACNCVGDVVVIDEEGMTKKVTPS